MTMMSMEMRIALYGIILALFFMWYKAKLPTTGQLQDLTTILNSRGGNILVLIIASIYFFHRAEVMYYVITEMIKNNALASDNGIALNGLTFDTGAFGAAFGALLKTMSPDSQSPTGADSSSVVSTTKTTTKPLPNTDAKVIDPVPDPASEPVIATP